MSQQDSVSLSYTLTVTWVVKNESGTPKPAGPQWGIKLHKKTERIHKQAHTEARSNTSTGV